MTAFVFAGAVLALLLFVYLGIALFKPETFS